MEESSLNYPETWMIQPEMVKAQGYPKIAKAMPVRESFESKAPK